MRVLYILAHHDDELGAWPLIRKYHALGARQTFVYMTDSAAGGEVAQRQCESLRALKAFGIPEPDCRFAGAEHGLPDGALWKYLPRARDILRDISVSLAPDVVVTHALEGGHPDHDAVYALTCWTLQHLNGTPEAYQVSLYNMCGTRFPFFRAADPIPDNGALLKQPMPAAEWARFVLAARHYGGQWKVLAVLWPAMMWTYLRRGGFHYQRIDQGRLAARPHAGPLMYEQRPGERSAASFSDISKSIADALLP